MSEELDLNDATVLANLPGKDIYGVPVGNMVNAIENAAETIAALRAEVEKLKNAIAECADMDKESHCVLRSRLSALEGAVKKACVLLRCAYQYRKHMDGHHALAIQMHFLEAEALLDSPAQKPEPSLPPIPPCGDRTWTHPSDCHVCRQKPKPEGSAQKPEPCCPHWPHGVPCGASVHVSGDQFVDCGCLNSQPKPEGGAL